MISLRDFAALGRLVLIFGAVLALQGCFAARWINTKDEDEIKLAGNRVSILTFENPLEVDERIADMEVTLPRAHLNEEWPQPGGYASNTLYHLKGPTRLDRLWRVRVGEGGERGTRLITSPIVAEGLVFSMDTEVHVSAFDAKSGNGQWRTSLAVSPERPEVGFGGGMAYDQGRIFVATGFGDVFALNPRDGTILWRQKLEEPFRTAPTAAGGRIYVTSFDNQLFALDQADGHVLWNYRAITEGAHILSGTSPAVAGDSLVAPFSSGELVAFLAQNGRVTWSDSLTRTGRFTSLSTLNDIAGRPAIDRGRVYAVSHSGRMVAVDLRSGQRIWSQEISSTETPWVAGEFIYMISTEGQLVCLYRRDGAVRWITQLKAYKDKGRRKPIVWSGPIMFENQLFLASSSKRAVVVNPHDGSIIDELKLPGPVYVAPIIADGIVYIVTNEGELIAYGDRSMRRYADPSRPRKRNEAEPEPGEIPDDDRPFWKPRMPDWVPVI